MSKHQSSQLPQASNEVPFTHTINVNTILEIDSTELLKMHPRCLVSKDY